MKIGFDARMIGHAGIGCYIRSLLPELVKQAPLYEFVIFGDPEKLADISKAKNVTVRKWNMPIYSLREQLLPFSRPMDIDLFHAPHFNIPLFLGSKMVVTVHDLIYLMFPESVPSRFAKRYAEFMIRSVLKKASRIIAVSHNTRSDMLKMFGDKYSRTIDVIHEAPANDFRKLDDRTKEADVRCRYRLSKDIILFVGSIKPHKNVLSLLKMFALLKKWGLPHQLVICGKWDKKEDHLKETMMDPDIRYIGEVPVEDLVVLYNMAGALVHLSLYEGFGLTILEAMKCGTPVVVTDSSSIPEVVGKSAFVVPPGNIDEIADTVYNVLVNKHLREEMSESGLDHVKKFSWEKAAKETLEVYRRSLD